SPTVVGLKVKLDRPIDRERPCCLNICTIGPARGPHAGELICSSCGQHRGWLSNPTAQWIESVATRFGAPTTPIVMRKSHTYDEAVPPPTPVSEAQRQQRIELIRRHVKAEGFTAKDLFLTQDDPRVRRPPPPEEAKARARWKTQERRRRPIARRMALWGITAHDLAPVSVPRKPPMATADQVQRDYDQLNSNRRPSDSPQPKSQTFAVADRRAALGAIRAEAATPPAETRGPLIRAGRDQLPRGGSGARATAHRGGLLVVTPASASTITRLVKVLGMLGSAHAGERAAAGLKAHELIRRLGLRWDDVITLKSAVAGENDDNWKKMARHCARAELSIKERNFITNVLRWRSALSPKQRQWLEDIYERVTREAA